MVTAKTTAAEITLRVKSKQKYANEKNNGLSDFQKKIKLQRDASKEENKIRI